MKRKSIRSSVRTKWSILLRGLEYRRILGYVDIDGWLSVDEATYLYDLVRMLPPVQTVVVEIGSWLGKSSLVIAKGLRCKRAGLLYCIDPFNADGDLASIENYHFWESLAEEPLIDRFKANMINNGVWPIIRVLQGYSYDLVRDFHAKIDLLFIDGSHEYEAVLRDFVEWGPLVKAGGIVAFHDVVLKEGNDGPWRVIEEHVKLNPKWNIVGSSGTLVVARKSED